MAFTQKVSPDMTDLIIKKLPYDLSSHAGLAFVGKYLKRINLNALVDPAFPVRSGLANREIVKSYLGLLCLGKNDFDAIENFRSDAFFKRALGLRGVPSSPTLRQRLDANASSWFDLAAQINQKLLNSRINGKPIDFGALECGYTLVDLDTFAMDNGNTKKELVGRTYAGVDGYCPFSVYLGSPGYCLELALRPGVQHSAAESEYNFERALPMAARLVAGSLLVRADSGFCSVKLMREITAQASSLKREMAFIIKWNPRRAPVETIAAGNVADSSTQRVIDRLGKRECIWQESLELAGVGSDANPARRVYRLVERTIDKRGVVLLLPEYVLEGWTTTLPERFSPTEIIALYCDHATHEQFGKTPSQHFEFKSDMDPERLHSGKFDANYLVCQLVALAMNLLRLIGQHTLNEPDAPMRHSAKRIKTVMQELMFKAARMIKHAGRWFLGPGESDSGYAVFERHCGQFSTA
jgi:hypothetical protein